ncbi:DUF2271 domain-containing protein [Deinococcus aestuarii]|uniref:DUF2271 domain-containing protein n=1 Tax=Deinococcus aestuarii TaxID=2774531 RepID=UPI001C0D9661|nr:DUF2271 domain-containing protein [Deinococcus aestuarii]
MTQDTRRSVLRRLALGAAALLASRALPAGAAAVSPTTGKKWVAGQALDITFTVATQAGGRVRRPYVAVWIEDTQGNPVRTLTVWAQTTGRGPRWIPDLRRWYRENSELLDTVSSPTRNPGTYAVAWDGKTDRGALVPQGDYYVCIETAREHGPYSLVREKVTVAATSFKKTLTANNDIEAASVSFGKA